MKIRHTRIANKNICIYKIKRTSLHFKIAFIVLPETFIQTLIQPLLIWELSKDRSKIQIYFWKARNLRYPK